MRLIDIDCADKESFKYSVLLYLNYCNIKKNHLRKSLIDKNIKPNIHIKFYKDNDPIQSEKNNPLIDLLIIDINKEPLFLTRNNSKTRIVKLNGYRYSITKPSINTFNANIYEKNREFSYVLTSKIIDNLKLFT